MRWTVFIAVVFLVLAGCKSSGESELDGGLGGVQAPPRDDGADDGEGQCTSVASKDDRSARTYYESDVYPLLRDDCRVCHVQGGDAARTAFVLEGDADADYAQVLSLTEREIAGYPYLLAKATAIAGHTAGVRFSLDSAEADVLRHFSDLLKGKIEEPEKCVDEDADDNTIDDGFLEGVTLLDNKRTLNKAAMIMLGRRATAVEEYAVSNGSEKSLRLTLRWMMRGPAFTEFLMTAANDQLLTNKLTRGVPLIHPDYDTSYYRFDDLDWPGIMPMPGTASDDLYNDALAMEPLALIAYIIVNDLDYRNVLRADYTVFNSLTYEFFDFHKQGYVNLFDPVTGLPANAPSSPSDWVAGRFEAGVGTGFYMDGSGSRHGAALPYPHAGILTTLPWLARWQNTNSNGQRKRAKMALRQFLGYDLEQSGARPIDGSALTDSGNPTFNNPSCTGCHYQLDSLAGTFQNWGYTGRFRLNDAYFNASRIYERKDALSAGYKSETVANCGKPAGSGGYCQGDLWYADRFPTGFVFQGSSSITEMPDDGPGRNGQHDNATLRWAAASLVDDPRFATGTVEFWYESVFNEKPLTPPVEGDPLYDEKIRAYVAQQEFIDDLAEGFIKDQGHGPYNLKDLLVALFVSSWFRADAIIDVEGRETDLAHVGMGVLLTPEQLERKLQSTLGINWNSALTNKYNIMYGGIDSASVTVRARQINPLMVNVVRRMAAEASCEAVYRDFIADRPNDVSPAQDSMLLRPSYERLLFGAYRGETPDNEVAIKRILQHLHERLWNDGSSVDSDQVQRSFELFETFWEFESQTSTEDMRCISNRYKSVIPLDPNSGKPVYPAMVMRVWRDMLAYFISDPMFLFE